MQMMLSVSSSTRCTGLQVDAPVLYMQVKIAFRSQLRSPAVNLTPITAEQALEMDELQQDAAAAAHVAEEAAELRAAEVDLGSTSAHPHDVGQLYGDLYCHRRFTMYELTTDAITARPDQYRRQRSCAWLRPVVRSRC